MNNSPKLTYVRDVFACLTYLLCPITLGFCNDLILIFWRTLVHKWSFIAVHALQRQCLINLLIITITLEVYWSILHAATWERSDVLKAASLYFRMMRQPERRSLPCLPAMWMASRKSTCQHSSSMMLRNTQPLPSKYNESRLVFFSLPSKLTWDWHSKASKGA